MSIVEKPFATELITKQGKIEKFDSIECLAAYILKEIIKNDKIHSLWVTDYQENDKFIEAKNAFYINSKSIRSPMGMFLSAFKNQEEAIKTLNDKEGKILNWDEVKKLVYNEWLSF
jgi:copper chaperone NosL